MNKREFRRLKEESPESIVWHRTRPYQRIRNKLARVLKKWNEKREKSVRKDYLIEKAFASERFDKQDYDFILWLEQKDLENFVSKLRNGIQKYRQKILFDSDRFDTLEYDQSDVNALFQWNRILRFISQTREGVNAEQIRFFADDAKSPMCEQTINDRNDDMKNIYPNWEEMVSANEADPKDTEN